MLNPFGAEYEVISVFGEHPDTADGIHRYLGNNYFKLNKGKRGRARLELFFVTNDCWLYRESEIRLDSLAKVKQLTLQTRYAQYNDVYEIPGEDIIGYSERSNFITKLYWSKSAGVVRYEKKGGVYWELAEKW